MNKYRINGIDSPLPRLVTIPIEAAHAGEAAEWARKNTPFKPFSAELLIGCIQVWDGKEWQWVISRSAA